MKTAIGISWNSAPAIEKVRQSRDKMIFTRYRSLHRRSPRGRLWAQNNPDRGPTFHFRVPPGKNDEAVMNKAGDPKVRPAGAPI